MIQSAHTLCVNNNKMKQFLKKTVENNLMQWIAAISVLLLSMQIGIFYGWTSPNTARLLSEDSPIPSTRSDISWLVSLTPAGFFPGPFIGSVLIEYIGGRKTLLVTYLLMGISWICVMCANFIGSVYWLFAARFIGGTSTILLYSSGSIYLSEISAAEIRGTLISLELCGTPFGYLIGVTLETYLTQKISTLIYLLIVLTGLTLFLYLKDSAYFLVKKGYIEDAKKSIIFYQRNINVDEKLKEVRIFVEKNDTSIKDKLSQLRRPEVKKSIFIIILAFALPDLCGSLTVSSYTEIILKASGFNYIEPEEWVIYSYVISFLFSFLTVRVLDKFGRRVALIISSIGTAIALTAIGLQFYLLKSGADTQNLQWIVVSALLLYLITFNVGYGLVPHTLLSEIFPDNIKSIASLVATLSTAFCAFIAVKSYQPIVNLIGEAYLFWIHAVVTAMGVPFALFLLIETKGKTFQEIQDKITRK